MRERIEELAKECAVSIIKPVSISPSRNIAITITTAVNEALELAARECEKNGNFDGTAQYCAAAIRKLKVE